MRLFLSFLLVFFFAIPLFSKGSMNIGVLSDGHSESTTKIIQYIKTEVDLLTKGEFRVHFPVQKRLHGNWKKEEIKHSLNKLYQDDEVDVVLVLGFASAVIAVNMNQHPKPTLASTIIHTNLANAPLKGQTSAKHNLNYLSLQADLQEELKSFYKIVPFKNVALLSDALIPEVMPNIKKYGVQVSAELGFKLTPITHNSNTDSLINKLPKDVDAVLIGALPRMNNQQLSILIKELNEMGLPTHAMVNPYLVQLGALSSAVPASNKDKYTKRLALAIQSILLGEDLKNLKVVINNNRELNINMKTAQALNISPSFNVMLESQKINEIENKNLTQWDLKKVSQQVLKENLNILSSKLNLDIGQEQVKEKGSKLYPQLSLNLNHQKRKDLGLTTMANNSGKTSLSLNQIIYDPSVWADLDIEKLQQKIRILSDQQTKLNVLEDANIAFLDVLKTKTLKKMQEDNMKLSMQNLKLAKNKAKIGSATNADIYRWESELANAQADFLTANANFKKSQEFLNQLLNRPLNEAFNIRDNTLNEPIKSLDKNSLYSKLDKNKQFDYLSQIFTKYGLNNSPDIATYLTNISIQKKNLKTQKQKRYLPNLSLSGEYSNTYYDNRDKPFSQETKDDWVVGVNLSLPLYEGGQISHSTKRIEITLNQLQMQLHNTKRTIEQKIRDSLRVLQVSKFSIELKQKAAHAAKNNYDLVYDAYTKGSMGIIELIDAQNSKIIAKLNAINSNYQFYIDFIKLQRSINNIDFFLGDIDHLENLTN